MGRMDGWSVGGNLSGIKIYHRELRFKEGVKNRLSGIIKGVIQAQKRRFKVKKAIKTDKNGKKGVIFVRNSRKV